MISRVENSKQKEQEPRSEARSMPKAFAKEKRGIIAQGLCVRGEWQTRSGK